MKPFRYERGGQERGGNALARTDRPSRVTQRATPAPPSNASQPLPYLLKLVLSLSKGTLDTMALARPGAGPIHE